MMEQALLQAINLSRTFGEFQALSPVEFQISGGEIILLTGPNGAGKTTLLNCLSGLLRPTNGVVLVDGYDLYKEEVSAKQQLAYVPDVPRFYQELTSWEHMQFICLAFKVEQNWEKKAETLLREFGLWDSRDLYPHNLSRGMRLKLGIMLALIRPFKVLLMDEPTSALDPESAGLLHEKLIDFRKEGRAILLTGHDLSIAGTLAAEAWRMERGTLVIK